MIPIARFTYHHEADLAAGFLRDAGIQVHTRSDDAGGMEVGLTYLNRVSLIVAADDVDRAVQILRDVGYADQLLNQ